MVKNSYDLVVLAAGMGSRFGGVKQVQPVGPHGELIIEYSAYDARQAGFDRLVLVIRRDIEADFRATIGRRLERHLEVHYVFQELGSVGASLLASSESRASSLPQGIPPRTKPWGTGHAVLAAQTAVSRPFAVINADDFYGRHGYALLADYLGKLTPAAMDYSMVGFVLRNTLSEHGSVARGVCVVDGNGYLTDVEEITKIEKDGTGAKCPGADGAERRLTGEETVSMNMWGFTPSIFDHLDQQFRAFLAAKSNDPKAEFFIPTVVNELVKASKARVRVLQSKDSWFGITYKEDKAMVVGSVRKLVDQGGYPKKLWA